MLPLDPSTSQFMTLTQELVLGLDLAVPMPNRHYREFPVRAGRFLRPGDRQRGGGGLVVRRLARAARGLAPDAGGRVLSRWSGCWSACSPRPTALSRRRSRTRASMGRQGPAAAHRAGLGRHGAHASDLNTGAAVGWRRRRRSRRGRAPHRRGVPGVNVQLPSELSRLLARVHRVLLARCWSASARSRFVIGGLSLANTVAAAVFERIRDFGVKRALGATDLQLRARGSGRGARGHADRRGASASVLARARLGSAVDARARRRASSSSSSRPRLLAFALVFSVLLGAIAGAYATVRDRAPVAGRGDPPGA